VIKEHENNAAAFKMFTCFLLIVLISMVAYISYNMFFEVKDVVVSPGGIHVDTFNEYKKEFATIT
jgi:hypothetical protein